MKEEQHMRTSMLALAIAAVAPGLAQAQSPSWQTNYAAALQKSVQQQKPLAVVFGEGTDGWKQLGGGTLTAEARRSLAEQYVPCYVDAATAEGKALARQFGLTTPIGLVISDRIGAVQAFWHQGPLTADALVSHLARYADPQRVTYTTETNPAPVQGSFYPTATPIAPEVQPTAYPAVAPFTPGPFVPAMGGFYGGFSGGFSGGGMACRG
jgi:hypothetical protein